MLENAYLDEKLGFDTAENELSEMKKKKKKKKESSFSAVSKPIFASKYAFFSIFRALQDSQTFAPLHTQNFQIFCKFSQIFVEFSRFCKICQNMCFFVSIFTEFSRNFSEILEKFLRSIKFAENLQISWKSDQNFPISALQLPKILVVAQLQTFVVDQLPKTYLV